MTQHSVFQMCETILTNLLLQECKIWSSLYIHVHDKTQIYTLELPGTSWRNSKDISCRNMGSFSHFCQRSRTGPAKQYPMYYIPMAVNWFGWSHTMFGKTPFCVKSERFLIGKNYVPFRITLSTRTRIFFFFWVGGDYPRNIIACFVNAQRFMRSRHQDFITAGGQSFKQVL